MSEWLKEHAWKACVGETLPRVRIPLSPPSSFARVKFRASFGGMASPTQCDPAVALRAKADKSLSLRQTFQSLVIPAKQAEPLYRRSKRTISCPWQLQANEDHGPHHLHITGDSDDFCRGHTDRMARVGEADRCNHSDRRCLSRSRRDRTW